MLQKAKATFSVKQWDEKPYQELDGGSKLTQAHVTNSYQGDLEGESKIEFLMFYTAGGSFHFIGLESFTGRLGGRQGSFVLQHNGMDENGAIRSNYLVVPGSGSGDLANLSGQGTYLLQGQAEQYDFPFEYAID